MGGSEWQDMEQKTDSTLTTPPQYNSINSLHLQDMYQVPGLFFFFFTSESCFTCSTFSFCSLRCSRWRIYFCVVCLSWPSGDDKHALPLRSHHNVLTLLWLCGVLSWNIQPTFCEASAVLWIILFISNRLRLSNTTMCAATEKTQVLL